VLNLSGTMLLGVFDGAATACCSRRPPAGTTSRSEPP